MNIIAKPSKDNIKSYVPIGLSLVSLGFLEITFFLTFFFLGMNFFLINFTHLQNYFPAFSINRHDR